MKRLIILLIITHIGFAEAKLTVLGKDPQAQDISKLYPDIARGLDEALAPKNIDDLRTQGIQNQFDKLDQEDLRSKLRQLAENPGYPIVTSLTLSRESAIIYVDFPLTKPTCILGSDALSGKWLASNLTILSANNTICYVIDAKDEVSFSKILTIANKQLQVIPLQLDEPLKRAGVTTYPALIISNAQKR